METKTVENIGGAALNLAHLKQEVSKAKGLMDDVVGDGKRKAERMMKRGVGAVEDCVEDTTNYIKRHPWQSVATAIGVGVSLGFLTGWLTTRSCSRNG